MLQRQWLHAAGAWIVCVHPVRKAMHATALSSLVDKSFLMLPFYRELYMLSSYSFYSIWPRPGSVIQKCYNEHSNCWPQPFCETLARVSTRSPLALCNVLPFISQMLVPELPFTKTSYLWWGSLHDVLQTKVQPSWSTRLLDCGEVSRNGGA